MVPSDSLGTVSYSPSIATMAISVAISEIFSAKEWPDLEIWVWGHSRSLKMVPVESFRKVSHSPAVVTMTVSCIVSKIARY